MAAPLTQLNLAAWKVEKLINLVGARRRPVRAEALDNSLPLAPFGAKQSNLAPIGEPARRHRVRGAAKRQPAASGNGRHLPRAHLTWRRPDDGDPNPKSRSLSTCQRGSLSVLFAMPDLCQRARLASVRPSVRLVRCPTSGALKWPFQAHSRLIRISIKHGASATR